MKTEPIKAIDWDAIENASKTLLTKEQVIDIVDIEGIGYAVSEYLSPNRIQDEKLAELWQEASDKLQEIERYLYQDGRPIS